MRSGSQCFHVRGVPTLKVRCPAGHLIRVYSAFYGVKRPEVGSNETEAEVRSVCAYEGATDHCIQMTELSENCNGRLVQLEPTKYHQLNHCMAVDITNSTLEDTCAQYT